jgi:hypothetical protein
VTSDVEALVEQATLELPDDPPTRERRWRASGEHLDHLLLEMQRRVPPRARW